MKGFICNMDDKKVPNTHCHYPCFYNSYESKYPKASLQRKRGEKSKVSNFSCAYNTQKNQAAFSHCKPFSYVYVSPILTLGQKKSEKI